MKKLMFAAAAIAAGVAVADVTSANVVGYQNTGARAGFNFYAPPFRGINAQVDENGLKLMDIQEIQLDDSVYAMTANLQRRDKDGKAVEKYYWLDKNMAKSFLITDGSKGAWVTQTMQEIDPPVIIREGDCVQVDFGVKADGKIQNNGEVSDGDITYAARAGFNFVGNAYPAPLNIQDIQLDDSVYAMTANLQRRDKDGKAVEKYYWLDKNMAKSFLITDGSKGAWVTQTMQKIDPPIILDPGEGVQVDVGVKADALITTLAPIEL